jgi:hypothetical protein
MKLNMPDVPMAVKKRRVFASSFSTGPPGD